jgi:hypothetical protein
MVMLLLSHVMQEIEFEMVASEPLTMLQLASAGVGASKTTPVNAALTASAELPSNNDLRKFMRHRFHSGVWPELILAADIWVKVLADQAFRIC